MSQPLAKLVSMTPKPRFMLAVLAMTLFVGCAVFVWAGLNWLYTRRVEQQIREGDFRRSVLKSIQVGLSQQLGHRHRKAQLRNVTITHESDEKRRVSGDVDLDDGRATYSFSAIADNQGEIPLYGLHLQNRTTPPP